MSDAAAEIQGAPDTSRSSWAAHVSVAALLIAILFIINGSIISATVRVWQISPTYSHCFFIIPISLFLIWIKRRELSALVPHSEPWAIAFGVPLVFLQLAGFITSIMEIQQIAVVGFIEVITLAVFGRAIYVRIYFPLLFLFFLIPTGEYLVRPLQDFTTWFISTGLNILGILHYTEGTLIELVGGTFRVAEACAGLRFLIATIAVGALFSYLNFNRGYKSAVFMLACVVVPIIANGFRALGIVLLAYFSNHQIAAGADHLIYGWGFSVFILAVLMIVGARYADPDNSVEGAAAHKRRWSRAGLLPTAVLAGALMSAAPALARWTDEVDVTFNREALSLVRPSGDWVRTVASGVWTPEYFSADVAIQAGLQKRSAESETVDLNVYYYANNRKGQGLISSSNSLWGEEKWHVTARNTRQVRLGERDVSVEEITISDGENIQLVWWTYWSAARFTTNPLLVKLDGALGAFGGREGAAIITISTAIDRDFATAEHRLKNAASAMRDLAKALELTTSPSLEP